MLVALDEFGNRRIASRTVKENGPFCCPLCKESVVLKKGKIKQHHYSHAPGCDCDWGVGESDLHRKVKYELYDLFSVCHYISECEVEKQMDGVCPDVSFVYEKNHIAIEVQKSNIDIDEIARRNLQYTKLGYYVLWISPYKKDDIKTFFHWINSYENDGGYNLEVYRPKQFEIYLHALYFGKIYLYQYGPFVTACHFNKIEQYVPYREWYSEDVGEMIAGGYSRILKSMKNLTFKDNLHITSQFEGRKRNGWSSKNWTIPRCNLWIDELGKWW